MMEQVNHPWGNFIPKDYTLWPRQVTNLVLNYEMNFVISG